MGPGAILALIPWLLLGPWLPAVQASECPQHPLKAVNPESLGVHQFALIGQMNNTRKGGNDTMETVTVRGYIRMFRTFKNTTRLFGYGWLDNHSDPAYDVCGPIIHEKYGGMRTQEVRIYYQLPEDAVLHRSEAVKLTFGKNDINFGFRMDAEVSTDRANVFKLKFTGWRRENHFSMFNFRVSPRVLVPWYRMDVTKHANYVPLLGDLAHADSHTQPQQHKQSHPSQRRALREAEQPKHQNTTQQRTEVPRAPPKESPLVMVVRPLHPARDEDHALFMAQTLLRHIEYHILQAKMQHYLLYLRPATYGYETVHAYLQRHMPVEALPYVTIVIWSHTWEYVHEWWDQHAIGYHAATAYSAYKNVMLSFMDLDEYLAWPRPAATIHEALARCDTDNRDNFGLVPMYTMSADCVAKYNTTGNDADRKLWLSSESDTARRLRTGKARSEAQGSSGNVHNSTECRWYKADPLVYYNWTNDDSLFKNFGSSWETAETRTKGVWGVWGKMLTRIETTLVFNHHRAEAAEPYKYEYLDPAHCPFVSHLHNLYTGPRSRDASNLKFYQKRWRNKWWLIPEA